VRVLFINLGYPPNVIGGAELLVQSLAKALVGRGIEVAVVSLSQNGADWQYDDEGVRAYFVHAHPMGIALLNPERTLAQKVMWHVLGEANIWTSGKLAAILQKVRPDIVNTHSLLGFSVSAWNAIHALGTPIVHTLHDYQLLCPRGTMFRHDQPCARQCHSCRLLTERRRWASAMPAAVVGISQFILEVHSAHGYFSRATKAVIPNGVRSTAIAERNTDDAAAGPLRIGFIGRLHPTKGVELLLQALKRLPRRSYIVKIAGAGRPDYEARLRDLADGLPVDFMGWIERDQFYRQIDVLVVPSVYCEPQGMVLIEAASFGVPAIYANRGGLGETGAAFPGFCAFDPGQADSLGTTLLSLVETPSALSRLRASAAPMAQPFTIDGLVDGYRHLYERVLAIDNRPLSVDGVPSSASRVS